MSDMEQKAQDQFEGGLYAQAECYKEIERLKAENKKLRDKIESVVSNTATSG